MPVWWESAKLLIMIKDQSFGAVVVHRILSEEPLFLLVKQTGGYWSFPKGHRENNETAMETAKRELAEETGVTEVALQEQPIFYT